jgi:DNA-directed RNA polymerase I, II, and III subunit RPABC2
MSDSEQEYPSSSETEDEFPKKAVIAKKKKTEKASDDEEASGSESEAESEEGSDVPLSDDDDLDDDDLDDMENEPVDGENEPLDPPLTKKTAKKKQQQEDTNSVDELHLSDYSDEEDDEEDDEDGAKYTHRFDQQVKEQLIATHHPEILVHNYAEVEALSQVTRDARGIIIDPLHRTLPFLTKYERTRVLGERAKQINGGAKPFTETNPAIIDGYLIALAELEQKKIPFILRRPLNNGGSEYWKIKDLEMI